MSVATILLEIFLNLCLEYALNASLQTVFNTWLREQGDCMYEL